jgi:hypothetical protein
MHIEFSSELAKEAVQMRGRKNPYITIEQLHDLSEGNEVLEFYTKDMVVHCIRYAETLCRFSQIVMNSSSLVDGTREEIERVRSTSHDATISSINILSRLFKKYGKDSKWLQPIMAEKRASYGKFAILIAFEAVRTEQLLEVSYV